jgi:hypothetical protein
MRAILIPAVLALVACSPEIPNSAAPQGVGFGDYNAYQAESARREAMLAGRPLPGPPPTNNQVLSQGGSIIPDEPVITILDDGTGNTPAPTTTTSVASTAPTNNATISDEQDFEAVAGRETIESDAERLARQRAQYQVIQPGALPTRPGNSGPNIVAFALSTTNAVGQQVYRRSSVNAENRFNRACAEYKSQDQAQAAFLEMGGPENDRKGMDPDGDGFACYWDPAPFRTARR